LQRELKEVIMKYLLSIVLLALIGFTTPKKTIPAYDWGSVSAEPDLSWADQVGAQRTPENTEWDAGKFGLRNDTSVFSTPAIQAAIDACHQQGGGTVVVAPGYYKIGALFIKSGVNLHLSKGTTLLASDNIQDYPDQYNGCGKCRSYGGRFYRLPRKSILG